MSLNKPEIRTGDSGSVASIAGGATEDSVPPDEAAGRQVMAFRPHVTSVQTVRSGSPLLRPWSQFVKRSIDIAISLPVVVFVLPVLCVAVKIVQWMQSSGPMFYRQVRCGRFDREFSILKFRTMHLPSPGASDIEDNPENRIFPLGKFLRNSKIDEIPQFVNVLLGSMSVVGPRPHHFEDCKKFEGVVDDYPLRSIAKPGITGLAQYREYRGAFAWNCVESRVERDLAYINTWSQWLDISLIAKTAAVVFLKLISSPFSTATQVSAPASEVRPELRIFTELPGDRSGVAMDGVVEDQADGETSVERDDMAA